MLVFILEGESVKKFVPWIALALGLAALAGFWVGHQKGKELPVPRPTPSVEL